MPDITASCLCGDVRITALADSGAWAELGLHVLR